MIDVFDCSVFDLYDCSFFSCVNCSVSTRGCVVIVCKNFVYSLTVAANVRTVPPFVPQSAYNFVSYRGVAAVST